MKHIETRNDVSAYVERLMWGVTHHAHNLISLLPMVLTQALQYAEDFFVREYKGNLMSTAWVMIGGQRYALEGEKVAKGCYEIVIRRKTAKGPEVARFTDQATPEEIATVFKTLKAAGTIVIPKAAA